MHQTPIHEVTPVGPFDRWPTADGFDKFYGFLGGEINHWQPTLYDGTAPVDPPRTPEEGYHLSEDIVDQAVAWIDDVRAVTPDNRFFCYLPFGATHAPLHVRPEWVDKYRGRFDRGWNVQRELTLERQKELGVVPADADLAPWVDGVPEWDELDATEQRAACLLMELYAGFAEHTDAQIGRFVDALERMGVLENTLIFVILGDNGASPEGGLLGTVNEYREFNGAPCTAQDIVDQADKLGSPDTWPQYPVGWALAMDAPYQWMKQMASHYGGTRNGMIVHWPERIAERGGLRHQWHHVIDVLPTILDAAGLPQPSIVDGTPQSPIEGMSMAYTSMGPMRPSGGRRSTSSSAAAVGSITRVGSRARRIGPVRGISRTRRRRSRRTSGSSTTPGATGRRHTTWLPRTRTGCGACRSSSSSRLPGTTSFRSTTGR